MIVNTDINKEKWSLILKESKYSSPFQSLEFYKLYNEIDGFSSDVFAIEVDDKYSALVVVTIQKEKGIKGYFSKRGIIYGGPLLTSTDSRIMERLIGSLKEYYKKRIIFLEIRNYFDYDYFKDIFNKSRWVYEKRLNVILSIGDKNIDNILSGMKYNRRREIRLSYKEGVIKRFAKDENEVFFLYQILYELYLKRVKLPLPDVSYFLNLFKSEIGKVFVVIHNDNIIGGSFCFYDNNKIYTAYYAGLRNYHKKIFPTHVAIMGVIEFAKENNIKMIDFMGAGKLGEDYGVRDYKLQFGGDLVEHDRYKIIFNTILYKTGEKGLKILSKFK